MNCVVTVGHTQAHAQGVLFGHLQLVSSWLQQQVPLIVRHRWRHRAKVIQR
jgi:hypothetical protein